MYLVLELVLLLIAVTATLLFWFFPRIPKQADPPIKNWLEQTWFALENGSCADFFRIAAQAFVSHIQSNRKRFFLFTIIGCTALNLLGALFGIYLDISSPDKFTLQSILTYTHDLIALFDLSTLRPDPLIDGRLNVWGYFIPRSFLATELISLASTAVTWTLLTQLRRVNTTHAALIILAYGAIFVGLACVAILWVLFELSVDLTPTTTIPEYFHIMRLFLDLKLVRLGSPMTWFWFTSATFPAIACFLAFAICSICAFTGDTARKFLLAVVDRIATSHTPILFQVTAFASFLLLLIRVAQILTDLSLRHP